MSTFVITSVASPIPDSTQEVSKAVIMLAKIAKYYSDLKSFDVSANITLDVTGAGQGVDLSNIKARFSLAQPNRFALTMSGAMAGSLISNGTSLVVYQGDSNSYTSEPVPKSLDAVLNPGNLGVSSGFPFSLELLLRKAWSENIASLESSSESTEIVDGRDAVHIAMKWPDGSFDIWVANGPQPLMIKEISTRNLSGIVTHGNQTSDQALRFVRTTTFGDWRLNDNLNEDAFSFTPPIGARRVEHFGETSHSSDTSNTLQGQPAPNFELSDLEGQVVKLSSLRGKVVVLEFWGTSCGPCIESLPVVIAVTAERKSKNVVFFSINNESKDIVEKFQRSKKLSFPVLLDTSKTIAKIYSCSEIPQLVIIDKDGLVQLDKVGYSDNLREDLSSKLDQLTSRN